MANIKAYKDLKLSDDFLFGKIMQTNPDVCRKLLEMILGRKIRMIRPVEDPEQPEIQKTIRITEDGKGVRLDVYLEGDDEVYDIEMQTTLNKDLPKRSRYYQGMLDLNLIEKGAAYRQLKRSYIIFICLSDPFDRGRSIYTFESRCREDSGLILGDETVKVFLNASGDKTGIEADLAAFLEYLSGQGPTDAYTRELDSLVEKSKGHEEWEVSYMTLHHIRLEEREAGRTEGILHTLYSLVSDGVISVTEAIKRTNLTPVEFEAGYQEWKNR